ncbi:MAG: class I SAM-dependent methyltransferase [Ardenticatenia bacterium]|nr:MAG: class I SAM-dependent methyltransferase [Ardenticatenia bacterium]
MLEMSSWARRFYAKQAEWSGVYWGDVEVRHRRKAKRVRGVIGTPPKRVLELGAGGGQDAIALSEEGYDVVAVEQEPLLVEHIRRLLRQHSGARVKVIKADFYQVTLPEQSFDAVCYWDGFGIGTDAEQRKLLQRIWSWLRLDGVALIDVYTPWNAAKSAGYGWRVGRAKREYKFDGENCRWIDRWWLEETGESVEQSLRCYSPADLRLLLEGTGLVLERVEAGGMMDYENRQFIETAPLEQAMWYMAVLRKVMD